MFDTHVHTRFSPDGNSEMSEYINLIDQERIQTIGFAEHLDFLPECGAYKYLDYSSYMQEIRKYKEKGYRVYAGAEVDYSNRVEDEIIETLKRQAYDYSICSVHMINGSSISDKRDGTKLMDVEYLRLILEGYHFEFTASLKVKEFDVIGHPGIFLRYLSPDFLKMHPLKKTMMEIFDDIARQCALSEKIIEVNTSGLFAPIGETIPGKGFLKAYYQYGGRKLSIGSDAHHVDHTGRGIDMAVSIIKEIGFQFIFMPWKREEPVYV